VETSLPGNRHRKRLSWTKQVEGTVLRLVNPLDPIVGIHFGSYTAHGLYKDLE